MDKERKRQENVLAELQGQADSLSRQMKATDHKCHQAETGVGVDFLVGEMRDISLFMVCFDAFEATAPF